MKNLFKTPFLIAFLATSLIFTSCSDEETIDEPDLPVTVSTNDLILTPTNANETAQRNLEIDATPNTTVQVDVDFTSDENMFRLYVTKYTYGDTDVEVYELPATFDTKADGSIDLSSNQKTSFIQTINFDTPTSVDGTVQYSLWATTGRGDFRDVTKRNAFDDDALGTIIIKGSATASTSAEATLNEFTQTVLFAPTADGTSESFISLFDSNTHTINEGSETLALWDFGYLYGTESGAGFYSTYDYPKVFETGGVAGLHVYEFVGADQSELNHFYFAESNMDFDSVLTSSDLDAINEVAITSERIQELAVGDVIEFVDQYGNKGLIKITDLDPGFNQGDSMTFDVKVQVNIVPVVL